MKNAKMKVTKVQNIKGQWLENEDKIAIKAVNQFQSQFCQDRDETNITLLNHIQKLITNGGNAEMGSIPNDEKLKSAVFKLNSDSASGPDGPTG